MTEYDFETELFAASSVPDNRLRFDAALNQFLDLVNDAERPDGAICNGARFMHALYKKKDSVFYTFEVIEVRDHSVLYGPVVFDESDRKCPPPQLAPRRFMGYIVHSHLPFSNDGRVLKTMHEWATWRKS